MRRCVLVLLVLVVAALGAGSTSYAALDGAARQAVTRGVKHVPVPKAARAVDTSHPDHVIGNGTPASCTSRKVVRAVAQGGVITFDCGPDPVVIAMHRTAKVVNNASHPRVVIDGGGLVTLSGQRQAADPLPGTPATSRQIWTHRPLRRPGPPAARRPAPHLRPRQLDRPALRGRRWRRDLRPRRAAQDRGHDVRRQPLRPHRPRPRGRRRTRALAVPRPARLRRRQHLPRRPLQQRLGAEQHRRLVDGAQQHLHRQPRDRASAPTRPRPGTPGGGSGGAIYTDGNDYTLRGRRHR